jgi:hypothetical protein
MDIKNLKEVVVMAARGANGVIQAKKDGKIDAADIGYLIPLAQAIGPAIEGIDQVIPEMKDLSEAELKELLEAVKTEVPSLAEEAKLMLQVEACLKLVGAAKGVYDAFKA